jgi:hypothetical protein
VIEWEFAIFTYIWDDGPSMYIVQERKDLDSRLQYLFNTIICS